MKWVIVYLNDSRVIGLFDSEDEAVAWAGSTPNDLFETQEDFLHADGNSDFFVVQLEVLKS